MPCLDLRNGRVVKGIHFQDLIDIGDPVVLAKAYEEAGADEIGMLDITASLEQRPAEFDVLPSVTDVEQALAAGARRASLSSVAFRDPDLVAEAVKRFGGPHIVVAIDADRNAKLPSHREVRLDGGRTKTGVDAVEFARKMADLGAGELLPTSIPGDGAKRGYDLDLIKQIADATRLPVVASGGAGKLIHFLEAVKEGHASTLLAASVFHFGIFTIRQVKAYLASQRIPVRNPPVANM